MFKNNVLRLMRISEHDMNIQHEYLKVNNKIQRIFPLKCLQILKHRTLTPYECHYAFGKVNIDMK